MHVTGVLFECSQRGGRLWQEWEERDQQTGLLVALASCLRCGAGFIGARRDEETRTHEHEDD